MRISILGTGNTAWVLGSICRLAGHEIVQVYGRNAEKVRSLAQQLSSETALRPEDIRPAADLYLIAVSDQAIPEVVQSLSIGHQLLVHTAGSVPMDVLQKASPNYGVLYPLQSLRAGRIPGNEMPLLVNASSPDCLTMLTDFAETISGSVHPCDDDQRLKLHLAAVLLNNFTNFLFILAQDYCAKEGADFKWLNPLLRETVDRLNDGPAREFQTGPAYRHDRETIYQHLDALKKYPALSGIYQNMSAAIEGWFGQR